MKTNVSVQFTIRSSGKDVEGVTAAMRKEFPKATFEFVRDEASVPEVISALPQDASYIRSFERTEDARSFEIPTFLIEAQSIIARYNQEHL